MKPTLSYIYSSLRDLYTPNEIHSLFINIMAAICGIPPYRVLMMEGVRVTEEEMMQVKIIVKRLQQHEPLAYILCEAPFAGLSIGVTPAVLIPRPETEELVTLILSDYTAQQPLSIIDIGTGSGCIACALSHHLPQAKIKAIDISAPALHIARYNSLILNADNIVCKQADILDERKWKAKLAGDYDIIVSNPPYVQTSERKGMAPNVLKYEPELALFAPEDDPLLFYRRIARFGKRYLKPDGKVYVEVNTLLADETAQVFSAEGFESVRLTRDIAGRQRFIKASNDARQG